jgi:transcription termination factor NusB
MMASDEDEMEDPLLENNNNRRYRRRKTVRRLYQWVDERKEIAKDNLDSS